MRELDGDELILHSDEGSTDEISYELKFKEMNYDCSTYDSDILTYEQVDDIFIEFKGYQKDKYRKLNLENVIKYLIKNYK